MEKVKILILDDEVNVLNALKNSFNPQYYDVYAFYMPMEAVGFLRDNRVDIIISDIVMPQMDGYEFFRQVRNMKHLAAIPFIFLTIKSELEDRIKGYNMGVDDYIAKPINVKELLSRVKLALKRKRIYEEGIERLVNSRPVSIGVLFMGKANDDLLKIEENLKKERFNVWWGLYPEDLEELLYYYLPEIIILTWHDYENNKEIIEKIKEMEIDIPILTIIREKEDYNKYSKLNTNIIFLDSDIEVIIYTIKEIINKYRKRIEEKRHIIDMSSRLLIKRILPEEKDILINKYNIKFYYKQSLNMITGGYYDYINTSKGQMVIVGDLMGYKWGGDILVVPFIAYITSMIRSLFAKNVKTLDIVREVTEYINEELHLYEIFNGLMLINLKDGNLDISYITMPTPVIWNKSGITHVKMESAEHINGSIIWYKCLPMKDDDVLILYNDTVKEILERPISYLETYTEKSAENIYDSLSNVIDRHGKEKDSLFTIIQHR